MPAAPQQAAGSEPEDDQIKTESKQSSYAKSQTHTFTAKKCQAQHHEIRVAFFQQDLYMAFAVPKILLLEFLKEQVVDIVFINMDPGLQSNKGDLVFPATVHELIFSRLQK